MVTLKCKVCGGDIIVKGTMGTCDSCGTQVSLEALNDERKIEGMNRANEARLKQDYDEACRAWAALVAEEPDNAEYHWNLALSRYGIDYVWDDLTASFIPNMNRLQQARFDADPDYRAAMMYANEFSIVYYMEQAKQLSAMQERLLEIMRKEKPYDVFISFKAEDNGRRTRDSILAQEIYDSLTAKGLKVFYSRVSLREYAGHEYEPHIFAALNSSQVMVLVGTRPDYLKAPWVKNEWSRFLNLMAEDRSKILIPAYEGMTPEFFPDEIPTREAINLAAPGAMLDLVSGCVRLIGAENTDASSEEVQRLISGMKEKLAQKAFSQVRKDGAEAMKLAPENADVWFTLLLAENHLADEAEMLNAVVNWMDSAYFAKAYELASRSRKQLLDTVKTNYESYQERLKTDSKLQAEAAMAAETAAKTAARARSLMQRREYGRANELLNDNVIANQEIISLRDDSELGMEYQKVNKQNYLTAEMEKAHPEEVQKLRSMMVPIANRKKSGLKGKPMTRMIGALLSATMALLQLLTFGRPDKLDDILVFLILIYVIGIEMLLSALLDIREKSGVAKIAIWVAGFFGAAFLSSGLSNLIDSTIVMMLVYFIEAAVFFWIFKVSYVEYNLTKSSTRVKLYGLYEAAIKADEDVLVQEYMERYASLEQYAPLEKLATVWENFGGNKI